MDVRLSVRVDVRLSVGVDVRLSVRVDVRLSVRVDVRLSVGIMISVTKCQFSNTRLSTTRARAQTTDNRLLANFFFKLCPHIDLSVDPTLIRAETNTEKNPHHQPAPY